MEPEQLVGHVTGVLQSVHESMLQAATKFRDENIADVTSYDEFKAAIEAGKVRVREASQRAGRCCAGAVPLTRAWFAPDAVGARRLGGHR
eukprot:14981680-Ditylum_brightwellii.AAC.1